jgi:hypothetical protein
VNDTTAETLYVNVTGGTLAPTSHFGKLAGSSSALTINAGAITGLAIKVSGISSLKQLNVTTSQVTGTTIHPILGSNITVSTADKFGNPVISGGTTTVTLTADTFAGQAAGFNASDSSVTYGSIYPYTPSAGVSTAITLTIPSGYSTVSPAGVFFFGIDYGSQSQLVATSSSGLATGKSTMITTYTLSPTALVLSPSSNVHVQAGSSTGVGAALAIAQKNVPVAFGFSSATTYMGSYSSTGTNTTTVFTTVNTNNVAVANATVVVATKLNTAININATETLTPTLKATPVVSTGQLITAAGVLAKLTVLPYFAGLSGSEAMATTVVPSSSIYLNITATDAYGNLKTVSGNTQLALSASAGTLSITQPIISSGVSSTNASGVSILFVAPSTVGTVVTITATGIASGVSVNGSAKVTVVNKTPLLSASGPTTWTSGIPSTISGTANASQGIANNKITSITYSVNGGTAQPVAFTSAANVAFSFSVLLTGNSNVNVTVKDTAGNANWYVVQVPPLPTSKTFTLSTPLTQVNFVGGPAAVQASFTNNGATSLTVIIVANVLNAQGSVILESTATVTIAAGATGIGYPVIQGIAHGTYTVQVTVYTTAYVTLSSTSSVTVTV